MSDRPTVTLLIDGRQGRGDMGQLWRKLEQSGQFQCKSIVLLLDTSASPPLILESLPDALTVMPWSSALDTLLPSLSTELVGFVPLSADPDALIADFRRDACLIPWLPALALPALTAMGGERAAIAWIATTSLVKAALPHLSPKEWTFLAIARQLEQLHLPFTWGTTTAALPPALPDFESVMPPTVLAIVPHYRCEAWLHRCLQSLVHQSRPLDNIVVIDDGSDAPPVEIVSQFPQVTLLASPQRVGPYQLVQQVISDTHYWAYLFQDADDWSSGDRLEKLVQAALSSQAELVGTQEIRVFEDSAGEDQDNMMPVAYPLDVNAALSEKPGHPLLHPTSLVTRDLVMRVGGFATGLRFGGDTEFLLRAVWMAKVINIPDYCYFRRKRLHSLTTAPETGLDSPARQALLQQVKQRAIANREAFQSGTPLCLSPLTQADPISLKHLLGPALTHR